MKVYRRRYIFTVIVLTAVMLVINSTAFLAVVAAAVIIPVITGILLQFCAGNIKVKAHANDVGIVNSDINIQISINKKLNAFSAYLLIINGEFKNNLFENTYKKQFCIPITGKTDNVKLPFKAEFCGNYTISFKEVKLCDIMGISTVKINSPDKLSLTVYPEYVNIELIMNKTAKSYISGEKSDNMQKGSDITEIFDLRTYKPGDQVKSIHWKLSVKTEDMIVREGGNPYNLDTLLYIDMGLKYKGESPDIKALSTILETGISFGKNAVLAGLNYSMAVPGEKDMFTCPITDANSYIKCVNSIMGLHFCKNSSEMLNYYYNEGEIHKYGRVIYVVWNEYPQILNLISEFADVIVIIVYDHNKKLVATENDRLHVVALADNELYKKHFTVSI